MIYFTFIVQDKGIIENPLINLGNSFMIWLFYILFSKTEIHYVLPIFALMTFILIGNNYIEYEKVNKNSEIMILLAKRFQTFCGFLIFVLGITGFGKYYIKQKKEKKIFSFIKFIFGSKEGKCKSLS